MTPFILRVAICIALCVALLAEGIAYVPAPTQSKALAVTLTVQYDPRRPNLRDIARNIGWKMEEFQGRMSRGRIRLTSGVGPIQAKNRINRTAKVLIFRPGAHSHVPIIGNAISAKHELGHEFYLGHANTRIWLTQNVTLSKSSAHDPFDPMTTSPGVNSYNAPHLHFLGWFTETEEAYAELGKEYTLRAINDGGRDFKSLKSLLYRVPESRRLVWFSYVLVAGRRGWEVPQGMPGTGIAVHEASGGSTFLQGLHGTEGKTDPRSGVIARVRNQTRKSVIVRLELDPEWALAL